MNAVDLLKSQHREVEALFAAFEEAKDAKTKKSIVSKICDALAAHAKIEEEFLYPQTFAGVDKKPDEETRDLVVEATEEHLSAKRIMADLLEMSPSHANYDAKVCVLKEQIQHHVKEEEKEMFPAAKKILGKERLEALGEEMEAMFNKIISKSPRKNIPAETVEAAPLS